MTKYLNTSNRYFFLSRVSGILFLLLLRSALAGEDFLPVLPYPQEVTLQSGSFKLVPRQMSFRFALQDTSRISVAIADLKAAFDSQTTDMGRTQTIALGIPAEHEQFAELCRQKKIWPEDRIGDEGYVLLIEKEQIALAANTPAGLFYGAQTLKQLVINREMPDRIPRLKIVDWPQFRYRGMQDDISRGPVPTLDFMKMQVRRCAEMKLNMLSYYIEHVVATKSEPFFAPAGGAISIAQWKELSDYARHYFVELVGSFQSFGHFEKVLANPNYEHLGESGRLLSPAFEESYQLLESVYSEMAPAFSSPFFNVNCDETWDLGRGASKPLVDSLGVAEVYLRHVLRLSDIVTGLGKRMMMWGDVASTHPEIFARIPGETVILGWDYSAYDSFDFLVKPIKEAGFDFFVVPGVLNSNRIMPDYKMTLVNLANLAQTGARYGALGLLNTVWDDGGFALFSRDWLGVAYAAEKSWNVGRANSAFEPRFDMVVYGDRESKIAKTILQLTKLTELAATQEMNEDIFWQKIIPERGETLNINLNDWDEVLAICDSASQMLTDSKPRRFADELNVWRFTIKQYRYLAEFRHKMLAAASAYRRAVLQQGSQSENTRPEVLSALTLAGELEAATLRLRNQYRRLWLAENKTYWLERNLESYAERILKLQNVQNLLFSSLDDFDKGHVLPPPGAVRLDIKEASGQYFQYWLVVGPFANEDRRRYDVDYLVNIGGEAKARGEVAGQFKAPGGKIYRWQKVSFPKFAECNLADVFEKNELVIAYAYARIKSPVAQKVRATFGSNDGIKVILNGQLLFERHSKRNLQPDEDEVVLPLIAGKNHLLLKIDQGKGGWGFSFRLPDNVVRNHKHKYRIVE